MSPKEPSADPPRLVPHLDEEAHRRLEVVKGEVNRHARIRVFGLLGILALLAIVYPLLVFLDGLSIAGWRKAQAAEGGTPVIVPVSPISRIVVEGKSMVVVSHAGRRTAVPMVPPERTASGVGKIDVWTFGTLQLGPHLPCIERGTAGILRALGRPSLYDAHAGRCVRIDGEMYDAVFTHATRDTSVEFR